LPPTAASTTCSSSAPPARCAIHRGEQLDLKATPQPGSPHLGNTAADHRAGWLWAHGSAARRANRRPSRPDVLLLARPHGHRTPCTLDRRRRLGRPLARRCSGHGTSTTQRHSTTPASTRRTSFSTAPATGSSLASATPNTADSSARSPTPSPSNGTGRRFAPNPGRRARDRNDRPDRARCRVAGRGRVLTATRR
jgi:hypothetical protein